jgi:ABC-2 type transport system permease protein
VRWLLAKDLRILARSPLLVALLVLYPVVIAALVGFAATSGPSKPRVALLNRIPPSGTKIELGGRKVDVADQARPLFDAIDPVVVSSREEAERKVRDGEVLGALILPPGLTRAIEQNALLGGGSRPRVEVLYNAEDPAKRRFVESAIKARVQEANSALAKQFAETGSDYIEIITRGGPFSLGGASFDVLGLARAETILNQVERRLPPSSPERERLRSVIEFASLARQNLGAAGSVLEAVGTPIAVDTEVVEGSDSPLGAFAAAVAAAVTLMFVTLLLASGALALEREENAFPRLARGLVSHGRLLAEKVALAALCSLAVGLVLLAGLSAFVDLPWSRFPLWLAALAAGAVAFGALGVAIGALAREVRAASLLAFMASLPIAVLGLVPSGAVGGALFDVIRAVSAAFPFKPTLDALESALGRSGGTAGPLLHLAALTLAFGVAARLAAGRLGTR